MPTVEFFFVPINDLTKVCTKLKTRYARGHTVSGTRSYRVFISKNVGILSFKRIDEDEGISGQRSFFQAKQTSIIPNNQDYAVVKYEGYWWIGLVIAVETISMEAKIKFMSPHSPKKNFSWPQRDDICWVLNESTFERPFSLSSTSQSGQTYKLDAVDFEAICKLV